MRRLIYKTGYLLLCLLYCHILNAQDFSNKGKDFWIGYGNHVRMFSIPPPSINCAGNNCPEKMQIYITSDVNTTGTVEIPSIGFNSPFNITANQITTIDIPRSAALSDEGLYNHGIHIVSALPVVVYSFIYVNAISGATLCLPTAVLGREYYSVNFTQLSNDDNSYSYFFVVATEDNTTVEIIPSVATKGGRPANVPFNIVLKKGQIYQVLGAATASRAGGDLTGSSIRSINTGDGCKKIAVFSGSGKISIGCSADAGSSDNLYQQVYPKNSWGKKYITTPTTNNNSNFQINFYRIIRPDPTTVVTLNGTVIDPSLFSNNFYYEFYNNSTNVIEADKPVLVAQYFTTSGNNVNCGNSGIGDPDMVYINPVEQTIQKVTLNSMQPSSNTVINTHFINAVLKNDPAIINSFTIDGTGYGNQFSPVPQDPRYAYARIKVSAGTHNLSCDSGFNAIAYGFGAAESYGYSAGSNMRDLYQFVSIKNQYATVDFPAGCKSSPFEFSITLPYQPVSLLWQFKGLFNDTTINLPVYDSTWIVNGRTLYRYTINKEYTIDKIGTFPITIMANNPTTDGCSGEQQIDYDLQIFDRPQAQFTTTYSGCMKDDTKFFDASDCMGRQIILRFWDFGDGTKEDINKTPVHLYTEVKDFEAQYTIVTDVGCLSDTSKMIISVNALPNASYTVPTIKCATQSFAFTDHSTINKGSIAKWNWKLGDGTTSTLPAPVHAYETVGTYHTTLQVESDKGCKSDPFPVSFTVNYVPKPAFETPEICLSDENAIFVNNSTIEDNTEIQFSYLWNFGDANATGLNPNTDNSKNPTHKYTQAAHYDVKLTVTSKDGCVKDTTIIFTVNGSIPKADFLVNTATLCSNQPVSITDRSTVDFGNITRVEIYWDYTNDPTKKTVDETPTKGKLYTYTYEDFGTPASKEVQIVYVAYSGITCINQATGSYTLNASPQIQFDPISPVCAEARPYVITEARETDGANGIGSFSGAGISSNGIFNPSKASPELNTIRYTFTNITGCSAFKEQTVLVHPTPIVNAGPDKLLLEGESLKIDGKATGNNLTYEWTPALYLDNAITLAPKTNSPENSIYKLTVTSGDGCTASDEMKVTILREVKAPNAFSPNGDGINDRWEIPYLADYPGSEIEIYNRYGQIVYKSIGYYKAWDGKMNGNALPFGTYYWIIRPKNGRQPLNGSVTIIR